MNPNVLLFPECGKGFLFVPGQGDHALGTYSHLSTRKCADICNLLENVEENTHCCSYELDHDKKKCVVNQDCLGEDRMQSRELPEHHQCKRIEKNATERVFQPSGKLMNMPEKRQSNAVLVSNLSDSGLEERDTEGKL